MHEQGYTTSRFGKWHLSDHADLAPSRMETYGIGPPGPCSP